MPDLDELDWRKLAAEARRAGIPPIQPNEDCPEPHYKVYYKPWHYICLGLDGIEVTRGEDEW